ncbi:mitochondrial carrier protein [Nitzschia inconspicua]|uniref:Mitochondrial carrier protein n=1 Tax=Nitzschia inconspicua TaxID=303405 RepID=A0A9K3PW32_9STRA|nr:mitochondrial carrier protein [Nitzschia inconspicua]
MIHRLILVLLLASTTVETGWCHVGSGAPSWLSSSSSQATGIIRRLTSNVKRTSQNSGVGVNQLVLGFQNALTQSSLPLAISKIEQRLDNDEDPTTSNISSAARFASVKPREYSKIKATMKPHSRQMRRQITRQSNKELINFRDEEAFWLDPDDDCDYFDDSNMDFGTLEQRQIVVPCSSKTQPVALQGKFNTQSHHKRRLTPSSATTATASSLAATSSETFHPTKTRGGSASTAIATAAASIASHRPLYFWENMISGAVSRSIAQTIMHPANCMKTMLQNTNEVSFRDLCQPQMFRRLTVGAGANFILSIPHGAVNFAVLEFVRGRLSSAMESIPYLEKKKDALGPALDFMSSCISTISCSIVSTPQMMITDNIMAGTYPNLLSAISGLYRNRGIMGFYAGWWPGLVGKIPSYALTWTFFQQLKRMRSAISDRPAKNYENTIMGCLASAATVTIMIPMDTIKTRLVVQSSAKVLSENGYKGIVDCAIRIAREEGIKTFYRGLAPRLISVVPMIGIQFGVYEAMKRLMLTRDQPIPAVTGTRIPRAGEPAFLPLTDRYGAEEALEEAAMEVAADGSNTFPAPHFLKKLPNKKPQKGIKSFFGNISFK